MVEALAENQRCHKMSTIVHEKKRSLLAFELASGTSVADAAEKFGVSRKTIYRQLKKPEFQHLVNRLRGQMVAGAMGRMAQSMSRAADSLGSLVDSDNPHIRVRASRAIISLGMKLREAVELSDRIDKLERDQENRGQA